MNNWFTCRVYYVINPIGKPKTKTMDRNKMIGNAEKIMEVMIKGLRYTLAKLQEITSFGTTELCMAILLLIRDNKVKQFQCEEGVCYVAIPA